MHVKIINIKSVSEAKAEIEKVGASPAGVKIMAPKAVFCVIKISDVSATAANILKQEMLSKGGEAAVHAGAVNCTKPKGDVILMGTLRQYRRVIRSLKAQPVSLPLLAGKLKELLSELED